MVIFIFFFQRCSNWCSWQIWFHGTNASFTERIHRVCWHHPTEQYDILKSETRTVSLTESLCTCGLFVLGEYKPNQFLLFIACNPALLVNWIEIIFNRWSLHVIRWLYMQSSGCNLFWCIFFVNHFGTFMHIYPTQCVYTVYW